MVLSIRHFIRRQEFNSEQPTDEPGSRHPEREQQIDRKSLVGKQAEH